MRNLATWLGGSLAIALALSLGWWALLEPATAGAQQPILEIPRGTAAAIERGEPAPFVPDRIALGRGGELLVRNLDSADHRIGEWVVPAGGSATIRSREDNTLSCTIHVSGALPTTFQGRPYLSVAAFGAAVLGLPVGLVAWAIARVTSRLEMGGEPTQERLEAVEPPPL